MSGTRAWIGRIALAATVTFVTLAITAVCGEILVRARERRRPYLDGTMPLLFYQHGQLGHALMRDFDYGGRIHIDREGFRGREVSVAKHAGVVRIMIIGSSTTFDPGVSADSASWPARLEHWLTKRAPGTPVEVINAGVPGYSVMTDVIRLETDLYRYQPDLIVLYEGHNDLFGSLRTGRQRDGFEGNTPGEVPVVTPWTHWLTQHSLLYGKLVEHMNVFRFRASGHRALARAGAAVPSDSEVVDRAARDFERGLRLFVTVAHSCGARVVIPELVQASGFVPNPERDSVVWHSWSYTVPFARSETVLSTYARFSQVAKAVAGELGATWIPTESFQLVGAQWYEPGDPIHFNDRGADRMAQGIADALVAAHVVDTRARPVVVSRNPGE
ncbi:MAG TPA: GDSL-type esterase/lipase family protein [Gemmatimonadales bacterium]|nr:GDSL-type esterase/lipase family protein [Gemmatimonadales bacterium]